MMVTYKGKPLPGCKITILTENKWQKQLETDKNGKFTSVPLEGRNKEYSFEKYLYIAEHPHNKTIHVATLQMIVDPPWPEYRSYEGILLSWGINITGIIILIALIRFFIKYRRDKISTSIFTKNNIWK